jgi:hypothetical protein
MRKDKAHELVNRMPENATWDDLIEEIYVQQVIEQGLADSEAGRTTDVEEVRRKYGLQPWTFTGPILHQARSGRRACRRPRRPQYF